MPYKGIPDLRVKLNFLVTKEIPRKISQHHSGEAITSLTALAQAIGFKSHSNFYASHSGLSDRAALGIQRIYRIKSESECWKQFVEGDLEAFKTAYNNLELEPKVDAGRDQVDNLHAQSIEVDRSEQIRRETNPLASLVLFTNQPGPGEQWPLSFELCCNPDEDDLDNVAVKCGRLTIDFGAADIDPQSRPGFLEPAVFEASQGPVAFKWNGPSRDGYVWRVAAEGDYIGNVSTPSDDAFCEIVELAAGNTISARFEITLKDLTHRPEEMPRPGNRQLPIVQLGVEELGEAKEWIVRRIKELALADNDGRVLLAEHVLPFRARSMSAQEESR